MPECVWQAAFLIPAGIILYTVAGGLKATFIASYVHTVIIYFALCIFSFAVYATCPQLGSPGIVRPGVLKCQSWFSECCLCSARLGLVGCPQNSSASMQKAKEPG